MADFVKKDWKCGDTITADELNRMENGIEEAIQSGGGSAGYECVETPEQLLFSESIFIAGRAE